MPLMLRDAAHSACKTRVNALAARLLKHKGCDTEEACQLRRELILPAWVSSCAAVLLRGSILSCFRAPVPPEARSGPFPARLAGGAAIWCRRPNACTLARTRGILWGMRPWRALRGGQAGAQPVSQPPAPASAAGDEGEDITGQTVAIAVSGCRRRAILKHMRHPATTRLSMILRILSL